MKLVRALPALLLAFAVPASATALPPCDGTFRAVGAFDLRGIDRPVGIGAAGDGVWVVASTLPGNGDYEVFAWRHSTEGWEELPRPEAAEGEAYLGYGADVDATGTLWVAGERTTDEGERHLVLRWDGSAWEQMDVPSVGVEGFLTDIEAVSPTDVWAVGAYDSRKGLEQSVVMHFDGTAWTRHRAPSPGCCSSLFDVSLSSSGEGWASGTARASLVLRLQGETWERVPVDLGRMRVGVVEAVDGGRAWASGYVDRGGGPPQGAILRWNEARWRRVEVPDPAGKESYYGIDSNVGGVWAAGARWRRATRWSPYAIVRRDGSWSRVPIEPADGSGDQGIFAIDAAPDGQVWAAGDAWDGRRHELTVHRACRPPQ